MLSVTRRMVAVLVVGIVGGCHSVPAPTVVSPSISLPPKRDNRAQDNVAQDNLAPLEEEARSGEPKAMAKYGSALVQVGRTPDGIRFLQRAVARDPKLTAAWHNLALASESIGWLDVAVDAYAQVVAAKPKLAGEWVKYGYVLIALGRYDAAEKAFRRAMVLQPQSSESLVALASLYYADFHFDNALDTLTQAIKVNPRSAAAWVNIAAIQVERHKDDEAEAAIRRAIVIDPKTPRYHLILGGILARSSVEGKRVEARRELKQVMDSTPPPTQQAEALHFLGNLARQEGDTGRSISCWRQALALDPSRLEVRLALGHLLVPKGGAEAKEGRVLLQEYERFQKQRDLEQKLRQRVEQFPKDGITRLKLGTLLLEQGNLPRAVWELREAVRLRPKDEGAQTTLVNALHQQGREESE